jgi:tetratricopeptide (TPR) repeat protein
MTLSRRVTLAIGMSVALLSPGAGGQGSMPVGPSAQLGQHAQTADVPHRAAEACGRGLGEMRKARKAKDPGEQRKHYAAAQGHFQKSLGLERNFDALLGLGQAELGLGDPRAAMSSCQEALELKAASAEAKACADEARAKLAPAPAAPPPG